jgi:hypothetical protein
MAAHMARQPKRRQYDKHHNEGEQWRSNKPEVPVHGGGTALEPEAPPYGKVVAHIGGKKIVARVTVVFPTSRRFEPRLPSRFVEFNAGLAYPDVPADPLLASAVNPVVQNIL